MEFKFNKEKINPIEFVFKNQVDLAFFKANKGEIMPADGKIYLGLGEEDKFDKEILKEAVCKLGKFLKEKDVESVSIVENTTKLSDKDFILATIEAIIVSQYDFDHYK